MFADMFRMAQATDARYAARLSDIKGELHAYLHRMKQLKDSMGFEFSSGSASIGAMLMNSERFSRPWENIRGLLVRHPNGVTDAEFGVLADFFVGIADYVGATERFLNYLARPIPLGTLDTRNPHNIAPFHVYPEMVAGIMVRVGLGTAATLAMTKEQRRDNVRILNPDYDALRRIVNTHMERYTLLSVVHELAVTSNQRLSADGTVRRMLAGSAHPSTGPFSLSERYIRHYNERGEFVGMIRNGITLSVQHGILAIHGSEPNQIAHLDRLDGANLMGNNDIHISQAFRSAGVNREIARLAEDAFVLKHQFDLTSFLVSQIMSGVLSDLYGEALSQITTTAVAITPEGSLAASLAKVTKALAPVLLYVNRLASKAESARAQSEGFQEDVRNIIRSGILGDYHRDFDLSAVFISEEGRMPYAHSWPTSGTEVSINVTNLMSNNNFTMEQFLQNPLAGFQWFDSLPSRLVESLSNYIDDAWYELAKEQAVRQAEELATQQENARVTAPQRAISEPPPTIEPGSPEQPEFGPAVSQT